MLMCGRQSCTDSLKLSLPYDVLQKGYYEMFRKVFKKKKKKKDYLADIKLY